MNRMITLFLALSIIFGCSTFSISEPEYQSSERSLTIFKAADPTLDKFFNDAYAYVVFPLVSSPDTKLSSALGTGTSYVNNVPVGQVSLIQSSPGFILGTQPYSELIFFENKTIFDNVLAGNFIIDASESATPVLPSSARTRSYSANGIAVFTMTTGGLRYQAQIASQQLSKNQ